MLRKSYDIRSIELGKILKEAGAENTDVARLGTQTGIAKLREFLTTLRKA